MSVISNNYSGSLQQTEKIPPSIPTNDVGEVTSGNIPCQIPSLAIVPYVEPTRLRVKTWPNLHSLFTLATLMNNVASLIFPHPALIGINVAVHCGSIAFASYPVGYAPSIFTSYPVNKAKISTDIIGIVAILIIKNAAIPIAIASDLAFEITNFIRCEISSESLRFQFSSFFNMLSCFFKKREEPPREGSSLDISRFVKMKLHDPTKPETACKILHVPLDKINDQEFIDEKYKNGDLQLLLRRKKNLEDKNSPFAKPVEEMLDNYEAAYKTLTERNKANGK